VDVVEPALVLTAQELAPLPDPSPDRLTRRPATQGEKHIAGFNVRVSLDNLPSMIDEAASGSYDSTMNCEESILLKSYRLSICDNFT
jgi:hypothetical protein